MSYLPIGPKDKERAVPMVLATDAHDNPLPVSPVMTKYTPSTTAYVKVTPNAANLTMFLRPNVATEDLTVASLITHKIADTNVVAATNPAITEANSYALANELKGDYNTHIAATAYHVAADLGACGLADSNSEPSLVALANNLRALFATHAANTTAHGGLADAVFLAAVVATTVANDAASAITLENALATAWLAHLNVIDQGVSLLHGAAVMPLEWRCLGSFFCKTSVSGHSFVTQEFRSS